MTWLRSHHHCVVTGGSAGIGLETARGLAKLGCSVTITGRNPERTEAARNDIAQSTNNEHVAFELADFSSLDEVRGLAARLLKRGPLHVLVNNAGLWHPKRVESRDGYEDTFAVNHLAPYLLTNLLLARIVESAPARIVNVSSELHAKATGIAFDDIHLTKSYRKKGLAAYEHSKLANVLFSNELARRLPAGVTSNAIHPGGVATSVTRQSCAARVGQAIIKPWLLTPAQGAETSVFVAASETLDGVTGKYFDDKKEAPASPPSQDADAARRLWVLSAELTGFDLD